LEQLILLLLALELLNTWLLAVAVVVETTWAAAVEPVVT
jgi:hypothetical protein